MIQRGGEVIIRMLENVKRVTIDPIIDQFMATGSIVYTDEYDIYGHLKKKGLIMQCFFCKFQTSSFF